MINVKKVADNLARNGAKKCYNCTVKSAHVVEKDGYDTIILNLTNDVPMMVRKETEDGEVYEKGMSNTVFITSVSLNAVLGYNTETASIRKYLLEDPEDLETLFSYGTVDLIQEEVFAGTDDEGNPLCYCNPFSENQTPREIEHDSVYTHLIAFEPGDAGWEVIDGIKDALKEARRERVLAARRERVRKNKRGAERAENVRPARHRITLDEPEEAEETEDAEDAA